MELSSCCGSENPHDDMDICPECKEHTEFEEISDTKYAILASEAGASVYEGNAVLIDADLDLFEFDGKRYLRFRSTSIYDTKLEALQTLKDMLEDSLSSVKWQLEEELENG